MTYAPFSYVSIILAYSWPFTLIQAVAQGNKNTLKVLVCSAWREQQTAEQSHVNPRKIIVTVLSIICATLLLEAAIVALCFVTNIHIRFGLIAVFTTIFATALNFLSNARLVEMFGASAAYAAVLVVFLAGNLERNGGNYGD